MKKLVEILFVVLSLSVFGSLAHAQNVSPTQLRWPTSCTTGTVYSPSGNQCVNLSDVSVGPVLFPADCQGSNAPSWCSGTTADAYIRAACSQLPLSGGTINLAQLTGTIAESVTCSTPTKQVIMLEDPTSLLTVTESDGGITFPLDNTSMFLGPGEGQCQNGGGIHLGSSANVKGIVGPAHDDGTEEDFTASGLCLQGAVGATVSQGLLYSGRNFANTTFAGNTAFICNTACLKIVNSGNVWVTNNWFNVSDGLTGLTGSPLIIQGAGLGPGCNVGPVSVFGNQMEHALGGGPEILVEGDGSGGPLACGIHIHDLGVERSPSGTASTTGIQISDCKNCTVENVTATGVTGGSAMIGITANTNGSVSNVIVEGVSNTGSYTNTINDTTIGGSVLSSAASPFVALYYSNPGYVQPPSLPSSTLQSLGADSMAGLGDFATGSSSFGTDFAATGCMGTTTCTFTRTNATAPPGYTWSQEVQITANTDIGAGFDGLEYTPTVSFTAGQTYLASFWGKGDGTFTGSPTFILGNLVTPIVYCQSITPSLFTTTWTVYSFLCTPSTSGSSLLIAAAETPAGATGTFWIGAFTFSPLIPLTPGNFVAAVSSYGVGTSVNGASIGVGAGAPTSTCGTPPTGSGSVWLRTDGAASTTLYVCSGTTWTAK